ncbi:hypothetical protein HPT27_11990 [Permianibacter sp. IMCC34836]|uniref:CsiV family protein n=1 Tax=Permianibacter fluminis TaxID=2738515 RepID=UPI00155367C9|nr:CsiV family protein [Permianibacter fluminis]NQD37748.1 hypothetical protein [Permianibacter fluminis]
MKSRSLPALLLLLPALLLSATALAADRWYEVEVLVFANLNGDVNAERWPTNDSVTLALDGAIPAPNTAAPVGAGTSSGVPGKSTPSAQELLRLAAVAPAQYKLLDAFKSLSRSRNYRPLLHTAWRQPIGTGKNNFKVRLVGGKDYAGRYGVQGKLLTTGDEPATDGLWEIDGYVRLSAAKFLHAETELLFRRPSVPTTGTAVVAAPTTPAPAAAGSAAPNLTWQTGDASVASEDWLQFFKFNQSRRLKSNELHYFDHPMFGMMIVLRPLEPERSGEADSE